MSLGIIIKAPEGLVLAAESRVTLGMHNNATGETHYVNFDNATKLLSFSNPYKGIGAVTYGQAAIGIRTAQTFIPEFDASLQSRGLTSLSVLDFARELSAFFQNQWMAHSMPHGDGYTGPSMTFNVAGFDDGGPYGKCYQFHIPNSPTPIELNPDIANQPQFGITWGGQREIVDRLLLGYDNRIVDLLRSNNIITPANQTLVDSLLRNINLNPPIQFMPLQDCINLAALFIRTTIDTQALSVGVRGCGGDIDIAIIRRNEEMKFIKQKTLTI